MNVLLKGREVAFYLEDPGAKVVFAWHDFAEAAEKGAEEAGTECILVKPGEFEELVAAADPVAEVAERADDDTAGDPLHLGHDRHAQGRRAHPRQPARNVEAAPGLFELDDRRRRDARARCRCSTPSARRAG